MDAIRTKYGFHPPINKAIHAQFRNIEERSFLCDRKQTGSPGLLTERVNRVLDVFVRSSRKSIRHASAKLQILERTFGILYEKICK